MENMHDKSRNLPDPDTFTLDKRLNSASSESASPTGRRDPHVTVYSSSTASATAVGNNLWSPRGWSKEAGDLPASGGGHVRHNDLRPQQEVLQQGTRTSPRRVHLLRQEDASSGEHALLSSVGGPRRRENNKSGQNLVENNHDGGPEVVLDSRALLPRTQTDVPPVGEDDPQMLKYIDIEHKTSDFDQKEKEVPWLFRTRPSQLDVDFASSYDISLSWRRRAVLARKVFGNGIRDLLSLELLNTRAHHGPLSSLQTPWKFLNMDHYHVAATSAVGGASCSNSTEQKEGPPLPPGRSTSSGGQHPAHEDDLYYDGRKNSSSILVLGSDPYLAHPAGGPPEEMVYSDPPFLRSFSSALRTARCDMRGHGSVSSSQFSSGAGAASTLPGCTTESSSGEQLVFPEARTEKNRPGRSTEQLPSKDNLMSPHEEVEQHDRSASSFASKQPSRTCRTASDEWLERNKTDQKTQNAADTVPGAGIYAVLLARGKMLEPVFGPAIDADLARTFLYKKEKSSKASNDAVDATAEKQPHGDSGSSHRPARSRAASSCLVPPLKLRELVTTASTSTSCDQAGSTEPGRPEKTSQPSRLSSTRPSSRGTRDLLSVVTLEQQPAPCTRPFRLESSSQSLLCETKDKTLLTTFSSTTEQDKNEQKRSNELPRAIPARDVVHDNNTSALETFATTRVESSSKGDAALSSGTSAASKNSGGRGSRVSNPRFKPHWLVAPDWSRSSSSKSAWEEETTAATAITGDQQMEANESSGGVVHGKKCDTEDAKAKGSTRRCKRIYSKDNASTPWSSGKHETRTTPGGKQTQTELLEDEDCSSTTDQQEEKAPPSEPEKYLPTEAQQQTIKNLLLAYQAIPAAATVSATPLAGAAAVARATAVTSSAKRFTQGMTLFVFTLLLSVEFEEEEPYFWLLLFFLEQTIPNFCERILLTMKGEASLLLPRQEVTTAPAFAVPPLLVSSGPGREGGKQKAESTRDRGTSHRRAAPAEPGAEHDDGGPGPSLRRDIFSTSPTARTEVDVIKDQHAEFFDGDLLGDNESDHLRWAQRDMQTCYREFVSDLQERCQHQIESYPEKYKAECAAGNKKTKFYPCRELSQSVAAHQRNYTSEDPFLFAGGRVREADYDARNFPNYNSRAVERTAVEHAQMPLQPSPQAQAAAPSSGMTIAGGIHMVFAAPYHFISGISGLVTGGASSSTPLRPLEAGASCSAGGTTASPGEGTEGGGKKALDLVHHFQRKRYKDKVPLSSSSGPSSSEESSRGRDGRDREQDDERFAREPRSFGRTKTGDGAAGANAKLFPGPSSFGLELRRLFSPNLVKEYAPILFFAVAVALVPQMECTLCTWDSKTDALLYQDVGKKKN